MKENELQMISGSMRIVLSQALTVSAAFGCQRPLVASAMSDCSPHTPHAPSTFDLQPGEVDLGALFENNANNILVLCDASTAFFLRLFVLSQKREHPGSESLHLRESGLVHIAVFMKLHNSHRNGTNMNEVFYHFVLGIGFPMYIIIYIYICC